MITVTTRVADRVTCYWYNKSLSLSPGQDSRGKGGYQALSFSGPFRIMRFGDLVDAREDKFDVGWIITDPSDLCGENNCRHYDCDGTCIREARPVGVSYMPSGDFYATAYVTNSQGTTFTYKGVLTDEVMNQYTWTTSTGGLYGRDYYKAKFSNFHIEQDENLSRFTLSYTVEYWYRYKQTDQYPWVNYGSSTRYVSYSYKSAYHVYGADLLDINVSPATAPAFYYHLSPDDSLFEYVHWACDQEYSYGDLTADAADSIRISNNNNLNNIKELLQLGDLAKGLTQLVELSGGALKGTPIGKAKTVAKTVAGTYLAAHYGLRLTLKDAEDLSESISKLNPGDRTQTVGAQHSVVVDYPGSIDGINVEMRLKAVIGAFTSEFVNFTDATDRALRALYEFDLLPTMSNLWDAVPWSFVVDWLVPLGDAMERLENKHYVQTLPCHRAFYSQKWTWNQYDEFVSDDGSHYRCSLKYRYYERTCVPQFILPPMRVDNPKGLSGHWVELSALLIQLS